MFKKYVCKFTASNSIRSITWTDKNNTFRTQRGARRHGEAHVAHVKAKLTDKIIVTFEVVTVNDR